MMKGKKINVQKLFMIFLVAILLFQESFYKVTHLTFFKSFDEIFILFLVVIMFATLLKNKKISKKVLVFFLLIFCFCFFGIISCILNSNFYIKNLLFATFTANKFLLLVVSLMVISVNDSIRLNFLSSIKFWGWVVLIIGIFNFLFPTFYFKIFTYAVMDYRKGIISVTSLFFHAGLFGWFMLLNAIIYYVEYLVYHRRKDKISMIIFLIISLFSLKTKVFVGIFALVLFEMIFRYKIDLRKVIIGLLVIFVFSFTFKDYIAYTYDTYMSESSVESARQSLTNNSYKIMKDYFPFGVGFGKYGSWEARVNYSDYYYKYNMDKIYGLRPDSPIFATDTFWPAIIGETGFIGLIIYILFILKLYTYLKTKTNKCGNNKLVFIYFSIANLALIQTICESFGAPSFNSNPQNVILGIFVGLALNSYSKEVDVNENSICNS